MNDPYTGITSGVFVADFSAAIGGAIVNEQHLDGHIDFLVKNTLDTFDQIGLRVIDWYDHADRNMFHNLFPFLFMQIMRTAQTTAYRNRCLNSVYPASSPGKLLATPSR